jgi:hypothetical protein
MAGSKTCLVWASAGFRRPSLSPSNLKPAASTSWRITAGSSRCTRSGAVGSFGFPTWSMMMWLISKALDRWAYENGVTLDFSRPGKPTDNAFVESFNGRLRDECLNTHWFLS